MKKLHLLIAICCFFGINMLQAQKAKFKSDICTVQKTRLPIHYTEVDQRTYDFITQGSYAVNLDPYQKKLYGWKLDKEQPNVKAVASIYGFSISSPKKHSEKKQKKDKDGNVTSSWTEYRYTSSASGKGTLYVYGLSQPFEFKPKAKKKSKWEEKQEAKKAEAKKDLQDNPFLSADVIEEAEESDIGTDSGLENADLELVKTIGIDQSKSVETRSYKSASDAYKDYTSNQRPKLTAFRNAYPASAYKNAMHNLNVLYGFAPVNSRFYLKMMKSDKHPQLKMWNDACQAAETIFKTFKYNEPIDERQQQFEPIVEYFEKQVNKISEDDKKGRKQKKAAFQNLMNILFYLDRHEDVMSWADKYMDSKKLDNISKQMHQKSERQKALLAFHNMSSSHFETDEEISEEDIETEELMADDSDD